MVLQYLMLLCLACAQPPTNPDMNLHCMLHWPPGAGKVSAVTGWGHRRQCMATATTVNITTHLNTEAPLLAGSAATMSFKL